MKYYTRGRQYGKHIKHKVLPEIEESETKCMKTIINYVKTWSLKTSENLEIFLHRPIYV